MHTLGEGTSLHDLLNTCHESVSYLNFKLQNYRKQFTTNCTITIHLKENLCFSYLPNYLQYFIIFISINWDNIYYLVNNSIQ